MLADVKTFSCELLSPAGPVWQGEVREVILPATDGQFAILAGRLPVVVVLGAGGMTLTQRDEEQATYYVEGGLARMDDGVLCVMATECVSAASLDRKVVWDEMAEANALPRDTDEQDTIRQERLTALRTKFKLAQAFGKR
jgi:F-type H+-transporting ATPase subunit epsilon